MQRLPAIYQNVSDLPISTREPPAPQAWLSVQDTVRHLYVVRKLPLRDVKHILERDYGFRNASERMFKSRLKAWGYLKNAKKDDWGALAILHQRRKKLGKKSTVFTVRGRERTVKDLNKYIRSLNLTEEEFLGSIQDQDSEIPDYIRAQTPELDSVEKESLSGSSPAASFGDHSPKQSPFDSSILGRMKQEHSSYASLPLPVSDLSLNTSSVDHNHVDLFSNRSRHATTPTPGFASNSMAAPCDQLQRDVEAMGNQMIAPAPLSVRYGCDDIESWMLVNAHTRDSSSSSTPEIEFLCARCHQPSSLHFASLDTFGLPDQRSQQARSLLNPADPDSLTPTTSTTWQLPASTREHEGAWKWSARCFLACIALFRGDLEGSTQILADAANEFEKMLNDKDPMLLTAAQQVASILGMHDQGEIAQMIMQAAYNVCERLLLPGDPVRTVIALWTATAKENGLSESGITSDTLNDVYHEFLGRLGDRHPYTIAAKYGYGWTLKFEENYVEAEQSLQETHNISRSVFGPEHMQSIFSLAATAGAQWYQNKFEDAMRNYERVIADASQVLGKNHPYTSEGNRRLGELILEQEQAEGIDIPSQRVEQLYWKALFGKVKMLGRNHDYSQAMKNSYMQVCKDRGVWEAREQQVRALFKGDQAPMARKRSASASGSDTGSIHGAY